MVELAFSEKRMRDGLSNLQIYQQLAFGAACCERMISNYETFVREEAWRDVGPLRGALDALWDACEGQPLAEEAVRDLLARCEECAPDSEEFTSLYTSAAQDAVFAVCSLLDFLLDRNVDRIISASRFSIDSIDLIVQEREDMNPCDPLREQKILEHPLMQQELVRQQRDLKDARKLPPHDRAALLAFRTRARGESNLAVSS